MTDTQFQSFECPRRPCFTPIACTSIFKFPYQLLPPACVRLNDGLRGVYTRQWSDEENVKTFGETRGIIPSCENKYTNSSISNNPRVFSEDECLSQMPAVLRSNMHGRRQGNRLVDHIESIIKSTQEEKTLFGFHFRWTTDHILESQCRHDVDQDCSVRRLG